ncbi:kinase-like protein [Pyrenochaeta sp. DS3sAY3a]|nr:kinase-like protein [Pyrenochaeta sp. DS3sAY3a]
MRSQLKAQSENPGLSAILSKIDRLNRLPALIDAEICDFWIPVPKTTLVRILGNIDTNSFMDAQKEFLDVNIPESLTGKHLSMLYSDSLGLEEGEELGQGGFGGVYRVIDPRTGQNYARKIMSRRTTPKGHRERMRIFRTELDAMRNVRHRHCVNLVASCTDLEQVMLLFSPVADMDLSCFLNMNLTQLQLDILRRSVGCITSALAYLHRIGMRHDDFKPNNILVHGSNVLLADFGFCHDFSDSAESTTTGPPTHQTKRYSAPEVFEYEPRNRLTDIWGLGCVLFEILSYLYGYKQEALQPFWKTNGARLDSFANNPEANAAWFEKLTKNQPKAQHGSQRRDMWLFSFVYNVLMRHETLLRPTAKQILNRLQNLDTVYPMNPSSLWIGRCCADELRSMSSILGFHWHVPQWPMLDLSLTDDHLAHIHLDINLRILATSNNLSYLGTLRRSGDFTIQDLIPSRSDLEKLQFAISSMIPMAKAQGIKVVDQVVQHTQVLDSVFPCSLEENIFWVDILNVVLGAKEIPRVRTVQLSFQTTCLERQPGLHTPYLVMTFDPREANEYEEEEMSYREGRDLWIDGTSVAATFVKKEVAEKYESCRRTIEDRKRRFVLQLNIWRTTLKVSKSNSLPDPRKP